MSPARAISPPSRATPLRRNPRSGRPLARLPRFRPHARTDQRVARPLSGPAGRQDRLHRQGGLLLDGSGPARRSARHRRVAGQHRRRLVRRRGRVARLRLCRARDARCWSTAGCSLRLWARRSQPYPHPPSQAGVDVAQGSADGALVATSGATPVGTPCWVGAALLLLVGGLLGLAQALHAVARSQRDVRHCAQLPSRPCRAASSRAASKPRHLRSSPRLLRRNRRRRWHARLWR